MIHETTTEAPCGELAADLYTDDMHQCDVEGEHLDHACSCGQTWPVDPWGAPAE